MVGALVDQNREDHGVGDRVLELSQGACRCLVAARGGALVPGEEPVAVRNDIGLVPSRQLRWRDDAGSGEIDGGRWFDVRVDLELDRRQVARVHRDVLCGRVHPVAQLVDVGQRHADEVDLVAERCLVLRRTSPEPETADSVRGFRRRDVFKTDDDGAGSQVRVAVAEHVPVGDAPVRPAEHARLGARAEVGASDRCVLDVSTLKGAVLDVTAGERPLLDVLCGQRSVLNVFAGQ